MGRFVRSSKVAGFGLIHVTGLSGPDPITIPLTPGLRRSFTAAEARYLAKQRPACGKCRDKYPDSSSCVDPCEDLC